MMNLHTSILGLIKQGGDINLQGAIFMIAIVSFLLVVSGCGDTYPDEAEKISHRGYGDNSIKGFELAIADGFKMIEADVRLRGEPVLLHDDIEAVADTLESLLLLSESSGVKLFIEFKDYASITPSLELISKYNVDVVLTSFNVAHLKLINSVSNYPLGYITNKEFNLAELPPIDYLIISQAHVERCPDFIYCVAWTIKTQSQLDAVKHKADFVMVDRF